MVTMNANLLYFCYLTYWHGRSAAQSVPSVPSGQSHVRSAWQTASANPRSSQTPLLAEAVVPLPGLHESSQAGSDGATANEGLLHQASPASQSCVFSLHLPAQPSPSGLASHEPPLPLDEMAHCCHISNRTRQG